MSFGEAIATCFRKYAVFSGRARLSEYWYWIVFIVLVFGGLFLAAAINQVSVDEISVIAGIIGVAWLGLLVPSLAVAVRRLHDTGRSGWFLLLSCIPLIGGIILLVFLLSAGDPGVNKYGETPSVRAQGPTPAT